MHLLVARSLLSSQLSRVKWSICLAPPESYSVWFEYLFIQHCLWWWACGGKVKLGVLVRSVTAALGIHKLPQPNQREGGGLHTPRQWFVHFVCMQFALLFCFWRRLLWLQSHDHSGPSSPGKPVCWLQVSWLMQQRHLHFTEPDTNPWKKDTLTQTAHLVILKSCLFVRSTKFNWPGFMHLRFSELNKQTNDFTACRSFGSCQAALAENQPTQILHSPTLH